MTTRPVAQLATQPTSRRVAGRVAAAALAVALAAISAMPAPAWAREVEGWPFAETLELGGQTLQLNGVGLRAIPVLKGYAVGLYLSGRAGTAQQVLADAGPKRLQLRMLLDVPAAEFVKAVDKGIARNTPAAEQPALAQRVARFNAVLREIGKVRKGDVVDLDYVPGRGLTVAHNGRLRGEPIPGADFEAALLRIFLGPRPVDAELKTGLLGGPTV